MAIMVVMLLNVGDEVVMKMDQEARNWGRKGVPNGTKGVVIGKTRHKRYAARIGLDTYRYKVPGIYEMDSGLTVQWSDGSQSNESWDVEAADKTEFQNRCDTLWRVPVHVEKTVTMYEQEAKLTNEVFLGELPETEFWEGDVVRGNWNFKEECFLISSIDHHFLEENSMKRVDGSPMPIYQVRFCDENGVDAYGGSTSLHQTDGDIKLIKRGNLWKMYHNEPLEFRDLPDEVAFAVALHRYEEMRNPATEIYKWTIEEALAAVKAGTVDGIKMAGGLFGNSPSPSCFKLDDRKLGERVRAATLKGFNLA